MHFIFIAVLRLSPSRKSMIKWPIFHYFSVIRYRYREKIPKVPIRYDTNNIYIDDISQYVRYNYRLIKQMPTRKITQLSA